MVLTGSTCCLVELAEKEKEGGREEKVEQTRREWLQKEKKRPAASHNQFLSDYV